MTLDYRYREKSCYIYIAYNAVNESGCAYVEWYSCYRRCGASQSCTTTTEVEVLDRLTLLVVQG